MQRINEIVGRLDRGEQLLCALEKCLAQRWIQMAAGTPAVLDVRGGDAAGGVSDRRLLRDGDDPGNRVHGLASEPAGQPAPIPALKHIGESIQQGDRKTKLSPKRNRHLARRTHCTRTNRRRDLQEPPHRTSTTTASKAASCAPATTSFTGVKRNQETLERDASANRAAFSLACPHPTARGSEAGTPRDGQAGRDPTPAPAHQRLGGSF
jgi:hypothetical protein